ncbi:hypothetical protein [Nitrospirillum pindoramense]|uniref:Uncharacterized protein n=1 Tax=Nitrospirillum amazonense TaxID=28077 RepID=A0A560H8E1_9PROT|nr:hypothetical protein [Nitrospirillum amazonense]TWB42607.1 hypothetical protein FBZ90_106207 [Nitrospirillum amazonense]
MRSVALFAAALCGLVFSSTAEARGGGHDGGHGGHHGHARSHRSYSHDHYVRPHVTKRGTYVHGHMQTNPNKTRNDNYSTKGNVNPYTGQAGTKPRDGEAPH